MRFVLIVAAIVLIAWLALSLYRGRQVRGLVRRTGALPPFPRPPLELTGPEGAALLPAATGVYQGTVMAGDWNDPVTVGDVGRQTPAMLHLSQAGLLVDRTGAGPVWIPAESVRGARVGRGLTGRSPGDGLLVVTWQLGGHLLDTGFRGDEGTYPEWLQTLRALADRAQGRGAA
ncbi:MAG TPA: transporter [Pseudonocardiaceae bacterium]